MLDERQIIPLSTRTSDSLPNPGLRFSVPLYNCFSKYLPWYLRRHFHSVLIALDGLPAVPAGKPLIVYSNHPSWWDPLLFMLLGATLFPGRRGFGPMEAKSLQRYRILERFGAFGVELDSARGGAAFVVAAQRILANPASVLWLTAEGAFTDVRCRPIKIRDGLSMLARRLPGVCIIPLALEYPFWNESRPEVICRFGAPTEPDAVPGQRTSAEWTSVFEQGLTDTMDRLSRDSLQRDPQRFVSLLNGRAGVGGIYDGWRWIRARSRGARFDASHEVRK